jgi:protein O-GlcNAc transferase
VKPGRNDPCPCGSGKKYKHCCEGKVAALPRSPSPAEIDPLVALYNAGRYAELENRARLLVDQFPDFGFGWKLLGGALQMQGKDALPAFQKTAELMPNEADAHYNLGVVLKSIGQLEGAVASYRRAVKIKPDYAEAHSNLGNVLKDLGQLDDAVASYRRALKIKPESAESHNSLGTALKDLGQLDEAVASYRRAIKLKPDYAEAYYNLGNVHKALGQLEEAAASYRNATRFKPDFADAHIKLGTVLQSLGQHEAALAGYRRALEIGPGFAGLHNNMGIAFKDLGQFDAAIASYHRALEIKADYAEAHNNLGNVLKDLGRYDDALACYQRALGAKPNFAETHYNIGNVLKDLGRHDEALVSYRKALELQPDYVEAHTNLLLALNFTLHAPEECLEEARNYGRIWADKVTGRYSAWQCAEQPDCLRVGVVSGDLHNHPVGYFLEGLLGQMDPERVELIAYPTATQVDALTARIKPRFAAWKPLIGKSDESAARLIHADGVHVLLDLSGHTGNNRLPVFTWKPAPVQASWLGYFATTGVAEMDYLMVDEVGVPEAQRKYFSETLWYLPDTRLCFTPPAIDLPVASLPALHNGFITFGCFQNLAKVQDEVLAAWGKIFDALPNAQLRWQCKQLGYPSVAEKMVTRLRQHRIDPARVTMHGTMPRKDYLSAHAEVDVMLDTFPYPGGTTTCEALWMGVPTITLAGDTMLARQGASMLKAAGLADWVTTNVEDYIDKAVSLAENLPKLAALRVVLREQASQSPLFDAKRFARNFEKALWGMWRARTKPVNHTQTGYQV